MRKDAALRWDSLLGPGRLQAAHLRQVCEVVGLCHHLHTEVGAVIGAEGVTEHLGTERCFTH